MSGPSTAGREVVGVDGAKESWVAVALTEARFGRTAVVRELRELLTVFPEASVFAIDVPLRLNADRPRAVDALLRRRAGVSPSTVFNTLPRRALVEKDYAAALEWCRTRGLKGFSKQSWELGPKILDAEQLLAMTITASLVEVHPEASFAAMNANQPLRGHKRSWNGAMHRRALLAQHGIVLPDEFVGAVGGIAIDDILDAAASAWSALRYSHGNGHFERLSVEGEPAFVIV